MQEVKQSTFVYLDFSLFDTNVLKGVGILLMLMHHLFFYPNGMYDDFVMSNGMHVLNSVSVGFGKLCVAIFVFLSGSGLTKVAGTKGGIGNIRTFYRRRYIKLMSNYWLIFLIFVPIEYFVLNKTFSAYYGGGSLWKAVCDFFGLAKIIGYDSYNTTWWFYGCIIILYLLFPLFYIINKKKPLLFAALLLISAFAFYYTPYISACWPYQLVFGLGMLMSSYKLVPKNIKCINILLLLILGIVAIQRMCDSWIPIWQDVLLCYLLASIYNNIELSKYLTGFLAFCGKHSFNIFLFHTFFLRIIPNFVFWSSNPVVAYITFFCLCIITSKTLELLKKYIFFSKLENFLITYKL